MFLAGMLFNSVFVKAFQYLHAPGLYQKSVKYAKALYEMKLLLHLMASYAYRKMTKHNNWDFYYIWHKSVRVGVISKCGHNFQMFSTSGVPEWSLCKGQLALPGHKRPQESKDVIHTS